MSESSNTSIKMLTHIVGEFSDPTCERLLEELQAEDQRQQQIINSLSYGSPERIEAVTNSAAILSPKIKVLLTRVQRLSMEQGRAAEINQMMWKYYEPTLADVRTGLLALADVVRTSRNPEMVAKHWSLTQRLLEVWYLCESKPETGDQKLEYAIKMELRAIQIQSANIATESVDAFTRKKWGSEIN